MRAIVRTFGQLIFGILAVLAVTGAIISFRFIPHGVNETMGFVAHHLSGNSLALYGHIVFAPIALALIPFQFVRGLRTRWPSIHRWMGRLYVAVIIVAGLAGFQLALHSTAGYLASVGFATLAVVWLGATLTALTFAMRRNISAHREWMIRSAALTFAAVTFRLYLHMATEYGHTFEAAYPVMTWACWVPNALLAEIYIWGRKLNLFRSPEPAR